MISPVTVAAIRAAADRIRGIARLTPLLDVVDPATGCRLHLKCENLQVTGAFKIRGAYNMMAQLVASDSGCRGAVTFSSGNHGLAVAHAARLLGLQAVIVMPTTAPAVKVEGARALGAEVIFEGTTTVERKRRAEAEAAGRGLAMVPPFDHLDIMAGQGTIGLEVLEQCPEAGSLYVQMSGGGLIAGIASAVKAVRPQVRIVGVEPSGAPKISASLAAGCPVTLEKTSSIADGLLAVRPGDLTFPIIQAEVDEMIKVDDPAIAEAVGWLFREAKLVVEPSGAITVAAVLARARAGSLGPHPTVAVLSGGNVAAEAFARYLTWSDTTFGSQ
jgi:threonine dehydratase